MSNVEELRELLASLPGSYEDFVEGTLHSLQRHGLVDKTIEMIKCNHGVTPGTVMWFELQERGLAELDEPITC